MALISAWQVAEVLVAGPSGKAGVHGGVGSAQPKEEAR
jgi:hypothetical protein